MTSTHTLNSIARDGTGLRLHLHWEQDRYHHHIDWVSGALVTRLLESNETDSEESPLQRPVLQQVSVESRSSETEVALGVGMSGQSHWAMSIETVPESRALIFDVACRLTTPFENLASVYKLFAPANLLETETCEVNVVGHTCRIEVDSSAKSENIQLQIEHPHMQLSVKPLNPEVPQTVRWRYRITG